MSVIIQLKTFCLPISNLKTERFKYTKLQFYLLFCVGVKLDLTLREKY